MASSSPSRASNSDPPSPATRVPNERSVPTRVAAEGSRRGATEYRSGSPPSRHDSGGRSGDGDATNGGGRSRGSRNEESGRGVQSDDDGINDNSKADPDSSCRGALSPDEFPLISVPLDTWVGRYVRITTPRHNGTTGLVHRTGNGWVNLQTSLGDVAKRAYDLVVIPQERASIGGGNTSLDKGDAARSKRYRGSRGGSTSMGSNSGSGDERKPASRNRNPRSNIATANSTSESSGQDEDDDGDEHDNSGRPTRQRGRVTAMDDGSDFDEADDADDVDHDERDADNDDERYDYRIKNTARNGRSFTGSKPRAVNKSGGRDRYGGGEHFKSSGRMSITYTRREGGVSRAKNRAGEHEKVKDRERARERAEHHSKGGVGRDRDGMKGESFSFSRNKDRDSDVGGSRAKRREMGNSFPSGADPDDKQASVSCRERVDRLKDKNAAVAAGKKDEAVIKSSWAAQMQKAKERPNLVHWRDELVAITRDSGEDFEDATLSVELMKMRCDVCYHEKSDGDKFCWNADCWMSPVFDGYFEADRDNKSNGSSEPPASQRAGYINTFGRETVIDSALTSALQAPVKWLETKRKCKLEAHEVLSEDPALYRWQCWASNFQDPNSKDPTFIEEPRFRDRTDDSSEIARTSTPGHVHNTPGTKPPPEGKRSFRDYDFADAEHVTKRRIGSGPTVAVAGGLEALEVAHSRSGLRGSVPGILGGASAHKINRATEDDPRGRRFGHVAGHPMDPGAGEGDAMRIDGGGGRQGVSRRNDGSCSRLWS